MTIYNVSHIKCPHGNHEIVFKIVEEHTANLEGVMFEFVVCNHAECDGKFLFEFVRHPHRKVAAPINENLDNDALNIGVPKFSEKFKD